MYLSKGYETENRRKELRKEMQYKRMRDYEEIMVRSGRENLESKEMNEIKKISE